MWFYDDELRWGNGWICTWWLHELEEMDWNYYNYMIEYVFCYAEMMIFWVSAFVPSSIVTVIQTQQTHQISARVSLSIQSKVPSHSLTETETHRPTPGPHHQAPAPPSVFRRSQPPNQTNPSLTQPPSHHSCLKPWNKPPKHSSRETARLTSWQKV